MKKNTRRALTLALSILILSAALIPNTAYAETKSKPVTIKIGSYVTPQSVWGKEIAKAVLRVKERTNGEIDIKHLHSGMLGSDSNMLNQVLIGGIQGAGVQTSTLASIVPEVNIIEMPFLFRDHEEANYLLDNVIMPALKKKFEAKGLMTSAVIETGFMDMVMSGPVRKPADLKTMKIGSWESPVHISFWKAQGAAPIPIPATEVFNAYARGMVDSGANTANALIAWDKLFGAALKRDKIYITRIGFCYQAGILVMNKSFFESLPAQDQAVIKEELNRFSSSLRKILRDSEPESFRNLEAKGYHVATMPAAEKEIFERNSQKVYKELESVIGKNFMRKVLAARAAYRKKNPAKDSGR
ncbi:MAG: TRAP transporter substrate-binding protein DctP [bacterium]